jgi:hypothetical protein
LRGKRGGASTDYAAEIDRTVSAGIAFKGDALRVKVQQQRDQIALRRAEENARLYASATSAKSSALASFSKRF